MSQSKPERTLNDVYQEAYAVLLVNVPPRQREDAKRTLAGFLGQASIIGYQKGWTDGRKDDSVTLDELLAEDEVKLGDDLTDQLYSVVAEARRGGGVEGGTDYTLRNLEGIVEEAVRAARASGLPGCQGCPRWKGTGHLCSCGRELAAAARAAKAADATYLKPCPCGYVGRVHNTPQCTD